MAIRCQEHMEHESVCREQRTGSRGVCVCGNHVPPAVRVEAESDRET